VRKNLQLLHEMIASVSPDLEELLAKLVYDVYTVLDELIQVCIFFDYFHLLFSLKHNFSFIFGRLNT
jgi:hypothetical protein